MYGLTVSTAETGQVVSRDEAKKQCGIALENDYVNGLIDGITVAATNWAQKYTGRQFLTATLDYQFDHFPSYGSVIKIPRAPLRSITSITYLDYAGVSQTWSSTLYRVVTSKEPGEVSEAYGQIYPDTYPVDGAVTIRFSAGYGTDAQVPEEIKTGIRAKIRELYLMSVGEDAKGYDELAKSLLSIAKVGDEFVDYSLCEETYA